MTCALVDEHELDRRYLAGQLTDAEAAAFEEHYFGCDRCWALVRGGAAVRAGAAPAGAAAGVVPISRAGRWWVPVAVAAGLGIVAVGTWRAIRPGTAVEGDGIRGAGDSLTVNAELVTGQWETVWPAAPGVSSYRVRIFAEGGHLLVTRELTDTTLALPADSLAGLGAGSPIYLEVEGFDRLRRPVVSSPLVPLRARGDPR